MLPRFSNHIVFHVLFRKITLLKCMQTAQYLPYISCYISHIIRSLTIHCTPVNNATKEGTQFPQHFLEHQPHIRPMVSYIRFAKLFYRCAFTLSRPTVFGSVGKIRANLGKSSPVSGNRAIFHQFWAIKIIPLDYGLPAGWYQNGYLLHTRQTVQEGGWI